MLFNCLPRCYPLVSMFLNCLQHCYPLVNMYACQLFAALLPTCKMYGCNIKILHQCNCKLLKNINWGFVDNLPPGLFKTNETPVVFFDDFYEIDSFIFDEVGHSSACFFCLDQTLIVQVFKDHLSHFWKSLATIFHDWKKIWLNCRAF